MATEAEYSREQQEVRLQDQGTETRHATFAVEGMTCASCAMRIEKGLKKVPGVTDAQVNLATEQAAVTYDPAQTDPEQMMRKVEAVGYKALPLKIPPALPIVAQVPDDVHVTFMLEGMTCASCAMRIEKGLKKVPGVIDAQVNLATERGTVTYDPTQTQVEQMVQKVEAVGYKATPLEQPPSGHAQTSETLAPLAAYVSSPILLQEDERAQRKQAEIIHKRNILILGAVLSLPVVILSMFFMNRFAFENVLLLILTTPVWAIVGWEFHRGALSTLHHGGATMDTLVSLGSTASYLLSVVATFFPSL